MLLSCHCAQPLCPDKKFWAALWGKPSAQKGAGLGKHIDQGLDQGGSLILETPRKELQDKGDAEEILRDI